MRWEDEGGLLAVTRLRKFSLGLGRETMAVESEIPRGCALSECKGKLEVY